MSATRAMICAACAAAAALLAACSHGPPGASARHAPAGSPGPSPAATDLRVRAHATGDRPVAIKAADRRGDPRWTLQAQSVAYENGERRGTFGDTHLVFYRGKSARLEAQAPRAVANLATNDLSMLGGVTARSAAGDVLTADRVDYNDHTRVLVAVGHVTVTDRAGNRVRADRATSDLDLSNLHMSGNIDFSGKPQ